MKWKNRIEKLTVDELKDLQHLIDAELQLREKQLEEEVPRLKYPPSYVQQKMKCGKKTCKCSSAKQKDLHGPYWFEVRRIEGRIQSKYIGKKLKIGVNKSESLIGAIFEFEVGNMRIEGFSDSGITISGKGKIIDVKKFDSAYDQLMKYNRLVSEYLFSK